MSSEAMLGFARRVNVSASSGFFSGCHICLFPGNCLCFVVRVVLRVGVAA